MDKRIKFIRIQLILRCTFLSVFCLCLDGFLVGSFGSTLDETEPTELTEPTEIVLEEGISQKALTEGGSYILSGRAEGERIVVDAPGQELFLLLNGIDLTADHTAAVYVKDASSVTLELAEGSENRIRSKGKFEDPEDDGIDAAVFARDTLIIKGDGALTVKSGKGHGIVSKDVLKILGGALSISSGKDGIQARDRAEISGGTVLIDAGDEGIKSDGEILISGGVFLIRAEEDGVRADEKVLFDGGEFSIEAYEGIETTILSIEDGRIMIRAESDGMNAGHKGKDRSLEPSVQIGGGDILIRMPETGADADAIDSNGDLIIRGGTIAIETGRKGRQAFDYLGRGIFEGGTIRVNGEEIYELSPDRARED